LRVEDTSLEDELLGMEDQESETKSRYAGEASNQQRKVDSFCSSRKSAPGEGEGAPPNSLPGLRKGRQSLRYVSILQDRLNLIILHSDRTTVPPGTDPADLSQQLVEAHTRNIELAVEMKSLNEQLRVAREVNWLVYALGVF